MDNSVYKLIVNFSHFLFAEIEQREVNGQMEECLVIPLRINGLYRSKKEYKGVFCTYNVVPLKNGAYGHSHVVLASLHKNAQRERKALGYEPNYILGNMKYIYSKEAEKPTKASKESIKNKLDFDQIF